jgi:hypothetical protein
MGTVVIQILKPNGRTRHDGLRLVMHNAYDTSECRDRYWMRSGSRSKRRALEHCPGGVGQGLRLHAYPMAKAHALPGISRTGVEQLGGELNTSRSPCSKELDPHRKRAGGTEDCRDSFGG